MPTIRESIAKYLAELARRGASKHTLRNYASDLQQFAGYFEAPGMTAPAFEELDLGLLREWLGGLYDQKLTTVTVRRKLASVRAVFKFELREGAIAKNPATRLRTPKVKQRLPDVMSAEKTNNLLDAVESGTVIEMPDKERDIAFLELLYGCGIRVSELVGINLKTLISIPPGCACAAKAIRNGKCRWERARWRRLRDICSGGHRGRTSARYS